MNIIKFNSTYKASGKQYEKIVFWNRFLRNKTELIITLTPALIGITAFCAGYRSTFLMIVYFIFIIYPFVAYRQFKSAVRYHLMHRDASEGAECTFTLMDSGILCEFSDSSAEPKIFKWDDFTTIYRKLGYYMFFNKGEMLVMLNMSDIPADMTAPAYEYIKSHIDHNKCLIR